MPLKCHVTSSKVPGSSSQDRLVAVDRIGAMVLGARTRVVRYKISAMVESPAQQAAVGSLMVDVSAPSLRLLRCLT